MKRLFIVLGSVLGVFLVAAGGFAFYVYSTFSTTANEMNTLERVEPSLYRPEPVNIDAKEPVSFLLLGTDDREDEEISGRTDTMIVVTVNGEDESMKMLSIPRDTRTEIVGRGTQDKINHAHAFGGAEMAMQSVENLLDIPIDYVATINMNGFRDMVDAVGGVTVDNDFAFDMDAHEFSEGELELDGDEALAYVRMRFDDPQGDFGRNNRQREVIEAVLSEAASLSSITNIGTIVSSVGDNVRTNLEFGDITDLAGYQASRHNIEQLTLTGEGTRIDDIYYLEVPDAEIQRVHEELATHLQLDT
ncbi:LCP family protein [Geomicrobium sp. JSM 1781026]|uniref:LCP family glycopolymer transferase n=1 Tax=Geomicrobium sp. JSM 1781026 TaxID=3344580 RepID=UPI0035C25B51